MKKIIFLTFLIYSNISSAEIVKEYYSTGQLKAEAPEMIDGKFADGVVKIYYIDGTLQQKINIKNGGATLNEEFFQNGVIKKKVVTNSNLIDQTEYHDNGKPKSVANIKVEEGVAVQKKYRKDGSIISEENFKDGNLHGYVMFYAKDGGLESKRVFNNGVLEATFPIKKKKKSILGYPSPKL